MFKGQKTFVIRNDSKRLRRLCSDDSDFFHKSESMCQFFEERG